MNFKLDNKDTTNRKETQRICFYIFGAGCYMDEFCSLLLGVDGCFCYL